MRMAVYNSFKAFASVAQYSGGGSEAAIGFLRGRDAVIKVFNARKLVFISIDQGASQARDRACAAYDANAFFHCGIVKRCNVGNKISSIGKVNVMATCINAAFCDMVVLFLEWPRRVNDNIRLYLCKVRG